MDDDFFEETAKPPQKTIRYYNRAERLALPSHRPNIDHLKSARRMRRLVLLSIIIMLALIFFLIPMLHRARSVAVLDDHIFTLSHLSILSNDFITITLNIRAKSDIEDSQSDDNTIITLFSCGEYERELRDIIPASGTERMMSVRVPRPKLDVNLVEVNITFRGEESVLQQVITDRR